MASEPASLQSIIKVTHEILQIQDLDILLERILTEARKIVNADAGSIYIIEDNKLKFSYTQNNTLQKKLPAGKKLIYNTFTIPIDNKSIAGYVALIGDIVNIEDAYNLDPSQPYSFDYHFDEVSNYHTTSMLTIPIKTVVGVTVGVIQLINAKWPDGTIRTFQKNEEPIIQHFADNAAIAIERAKMTRSMIFRMVKMAELRDPAETFSHVSRVAAYSVEIYEVWARKKGIPEREIQHNRDLLRMAATLHDVGKIAIPDHILKKAGPLTPEERLVMQQHPIQGAKLFLESYSDFDSACFLVTLNHHERWDGTGYPGNVNVIDGTPLPGYQTADGRAAGKYGTEIPIFGRIVCIADVFDALISKRVYKEAWPEEKVLETIQAESGKQFDPEIVSIFLNSMDSIRAIKARYPD